MTTLSRPELEELPCDHELIPYTELDAFATAGFVCLREGCNALVDVCAECSEPVGSCDDCRSLPAQPEKEKPDAP